MNSKILNILAIILTIVLWGLQMLPEHTSNPFLLWIKDNLYYIAGVAASIVIVLHVLDLFKGRERHIKEWLVTFLKHILDEHLAGEYYHTRISILRIESGYKVFFKSFFHFVIRNFFNNFKNSTWGNAFKDIAVHFGADYLTVYVRYSYPKGKHSHVYFRLSDKSNRHQFNGIADKCYVEGLPQSVHTINISEIDVTRPLEQLSKKEQGKVRKYMKDSHFSSAFYDSLRLMHRISNNLYAVPITLSNQSIWGVVIIDNVSDEKCNFEVDLSTFMSSYMKIINFSLSSLKKN